MIGRLFKFHGGIKPDAHKNESAGPAIQRAPLPARLVVPLRQSPRAAATCIVEVGQQVLKALGAGYEEFHAGYVHNRESGALRARSAPGMSRSRGSGCTAGRAAGGVRSAAGRAAPPRLSASALRACNSARCCGYRAAIVVGDMAGVSRGGSLILTDLTRAHSA